MMTIRLRIVFLFLLLGSTGINSEIIPGQAVSWTDFSHITCITVGYDYTYIGTTDGILRYHRRDHNWADPITKSDGLPDSYINRLTVTFDDLVIYAETNSGIYSHNDFLDSWSLDNEFPLDNYHDSRPPDPIPDILLPFGYLLSDGGYFTDNFFRDFQITAYFDDRSDNVFIGTWGLGLIRADNLSLIGELHPYGLLQKETDAIYLDGDSIWVGGNGGFRPSQFAQARLGVTLFDRHFGRFEHFEPRYLHDFDSEIIYDISGDKKNIYFAGQYGLTILSKKKGELRALTGRHGLPDNEATAVVARNDSVWIGTARGLALYTPSADTLVTISRNILQERFITALKIAKDVLIIGTAKGTYYIDLKSKIIGRLKDEEGILDGEIRHIAFYKNELLISSSWGLASINIKTEKSKSIPYITSAGGSFASAINDRYIASAVDDGLILIERQSGRMRRFTEDDGLLSIRIRALVSDGNFLWIGSDEGLTRFKWINPDRVD